MTRITAGLVVGHIPGCGPRGVEAVTNSVNIADPTTGSRKAKVTAKGDLVTSLCDPFTSVGTSACARVGGGKLKVGDGSGALSVDGTVTPSRA